jgi:glycosyltransferase involved in cell wall biosynthesis
MEKILSIIVPSYNMEDYLSRCLTSVLDHKWDEDLEVIVVNDGSKDQTLQIAQVYKEKFPKIVTVIDKENGHYGSTINAALPIAKGKYTKILDADDWFDTKEFERFIERLKNIEGDLVITDYTINYVSGKKKKKIYPLNKDSRTYDFSIMLLPKLLRLEMPSTSYCTELLRRINYQQSEGIFYTDQEWVFYPMFFVNRIAYINANVYQYLSGREGQAGDPNVSKKTIFSHNVIGIEKMLSDYFLLENKIEISKNRKAFLYYRIVRRLNWLYKYYLLGLSNKNFDLAKVRELDENFKMKNEEIYLLVEKTGLNKLIPYVWYWRKYKKRIPRWIIKILSDFGI